MSVMLSSSSERGGGVGSDATSWGWRPATRLVSSAVSATVRAIGPSWQNWSRLNGGIAGTRPNGALYPTTPQNDAGMRIDPPMSEPVARYDVPAARLAPEPPEEPPGV